MPGEVLWPTVAFGTMILLVFGGLALLRVLPQPKSRVPPPSDREALLEDLETRLGRLDELQERVNELEERVDFTERILAKQRDADRSVLPPE
jgi:hypothetical protein